MVLISSLYDDIPLRRRLSSFDPLFISVANNMSEVLIDAILHFVCMAQIYVMVWARFLPTDFKRCLCKLEKRLNRVLISTC